MKFKNMETKYDFNQVEQGKYDEWVKKGYFTAGESNKESFTIVIPPPNITGKLHLGHTLDTTLQDIIIRRKRMQGYDALYLPGMDHASIATQAKIEAKLKTEGKSRYSLGREKFLEVAWQWKEEYSNLIRKQWAILGLSLDYTRERFTLDQKLNEAVNEVFVRMYNENIIYRGEKIINWDCQSKTALSNIEVDYKEVEGALYHINYPFVDGNGGMTIATTRPETMFGDVALMVNPQDVRYKKYVGRSVYIPLTTRIIPVIEDDYVDVEFGTGVVKVTPAHDPNDFEVGNRHNLSRPLCINEDGTMSEIAGIYKDLDRFVCREKVVEDLVSQKLLVRTEKIIHSVGHSERTGVMVEPMLSKQWFVKMDVLANELIKMQNNPQEKINFVPERFEKIFLNWLDNIQDWCISRQLWWGHRIPAWYKDGDVYVGINPPVGEGWVQDEDALDTWFSSALWPFSTLGWPENTKDFKKFFPTDVLVTGYDIIFFWVARMAFQSKYLIGTRPFKDVLIHGIIRDELGRKVSKSLNNGADMIEVRDTYGIDSLRYFLTTNNTPGQDIRFSEEKIEASWNYINKIWNISRYIGMSIEAQGYKNQEINVDLLNIFDKWILSELNKVIENIDVNYEKYEFGEVAKVIYKFVWNDFASWYLEMTKVVFQDGTDAEKNNTCAILVYVLKSILKILHPFIPFVTEDIFMRLEESSIVVSEWPVINDAFNFKDAEKADYIYSIITAVRNIRATKNVPNSKKINLNLELKGSNFANLINNNLKYLQKFCNYDEISIVSELKDQKRSAVAVLDEIVVSIPLASLVNLDEEVSRLKMKKNSTLEEIKRIENMLDNPNFIKKAPKEKIDLEKEKLDSYKKILLDIEKMIDEIT
ncbi:MAG: valine--tRNA ligase [Bacilli bacterium]|nr:valine--tRNA ligase [Bacilli bacterium]